MKKLSALALIVIFILSLLGIAASPSSAMRRLPPIIVCVTEPCP